MYTYLFSIAAENICVFRMPNGQIIHLSESNAINCDLVENEDKERIENYFMSF